MGRPGCLLLISAMTEHQQPDTIKWLPWFFYNDEMIPHLQWFFFFIDINGLKIYTLCIVYPVILAVGEGEGDEIFTEQLAHRVILTRTLLNFMAAPMSSWTHSSLTSTLFYCFLPVAIWPVLFSPSLVNCIREKHLLKTLESCKYSFIHSFWLPLTSLHRAIALQSKVQCISINFKFKAL